MTPASGLRVRIGRIDGSIWGQTQLKDVRLYDPDGLFAESPKSTWTGGRWTSSGTASSSTICGPNCHPHRLPQLIPSREPRPLLPRYDVHIGRLAVRQLGSGRA